MRYVTSDNRYTTTFPIAVRNILLETVPVDEEDYSRGSDLRDYHGVVINEETYIDINHRFADLEGEVRTLLAMNRIGVGTQSYNDPDCPSLSINQALLINLALDLNGVIHTSLYLELFKKNIFCAQMLVSIVEMAEAVLSDDEEQDVFKDTLFGGVYSRFSNGLKARLFH